MRKADRIGQKIGWLRVQEVSGKLYACLCACGKVCFLTHEQLRNRAAKSKVWVASCGCRQGRQPLLTPEEAALKRLYGRYRYGANKNGRVFLLSLDEFRKLTKENCTYCGSLPWQVARIRMKRAWASTYTPGLTA